MSSALMDIFALAVPGALFAWGIQLIRGSSSRHSLERLEMLRVSSAQAPTRSRFNSPRIDSKKKSSSIILLAMIALVSLNLFSQNGSLSRIFVSLGMGAALGIIIRERVAESRLSAHRKKIDYYLPIVMERIVMAVESGLDILPALRTVVEIENQNAQDPVTAHFQRLYEYTEKGIPFQSALEMVSETAESPSLKHALVHLGIAFEQGGEIMHPLRELSEATQLYYQESIEEEIAKLPVKATVPLLCTFAGLIIFFLATPIIQVMSITSKALPR